MEAAEINQKAGNYHAALASYEQLAGLALIQGRLFQAVDLYRNGLKLAQNWDEARNKTHRSLLAAVGLQLDLGTVLYQLNDLVDAEAHLQRSAELFELGESWGRMHSYTMLAYLRQAQGEIEASLKLFRKACAVEDSLVIRRSYTSDRPSLIKLGILLSRAGLETTSLLADAGRRIERLGVHADDDVDFASSAGYPREAIYTDLASLLISLDRPAEALPLLTHLLEAAIAMERYGDESRYLVLMALAHFALGNAQTALDALGQALTLAEVQGYVRLFVDEGQPMAELLRFALAQNISPGYAGKLLTAFPKDLLSAIPIDEAPAVHPQILPEPLSERELEVLRLMADGCTYQEIAERLVISINTVRHHTRNVYGKLDTNSRTQAIRRAKELDLL